MKVREVVKRIKADGWVLARYGGRSSHRIYKFDLCREEGQNVPNITVLEIRETHEVETLEPRVAAVA